MGFLKFILCVILINATFNKFNISPDIKYIGSCILCASWILYSELKIPKDIFFLLKQNKED